MKVYIGIDWSENKHDVCFLNEKGDVLRVLQIAHTIAGFRQLDQARESLGVGRQEVIIGLETAHNLLVDYLWDQSYEQIYVLPPAAVKSAQKRYRQSGAKDDAWDAHLIASLRTDQRCYTPWQPDQPLTPDPGGVCAGGSVGTAWSGWQPAAVDPAALLPSGSRRFPASGQCRFSRLFADLPHAAPSPRVEF
jgi:hypothetical protein